MTAKEKQSEKYNKTDGVAFHNLYKYYPKYSLNQKMLAGKWWLFFQFIIFSTNLLNIYIYIYIY